MNVKNMMNDYNIYIFSYLNSVYIYNLMMMT